MKKVFLSLILFLCALLTSCISTSKILFDNLKIQIEETEKEYLSKVTISGFKITSALSIKDYQIKYDNDRIFIKINESLKNTGMSTDYYVQFLMKKNVKEIYIENQLVWTNSVESYFKNQKFEFPININKVIDERITSIEKQEKLSESEQKSVKEFMQYLSKKITIEKCKKWKKNAIAFNISNFGIFEDAGKKYFCISVDAYFENEKIYDMVKKVDNMDISVLHNILLYDYETYEELGWVF